MVQRATNAFRIDIRHGPDGTTVRPCGDVDLATAEQLVACLWVAAHLDDRGRPVDVELGGVSFLDAHGLRALLGVKRRLGERLVLRPGQPHVNRLFELTGTTGELAGPHVRDRRLSPARAAAPPLLRRARARPRPAA